MNVTIFLIVALVATISSAIPARSNSFVDLIIDLQDFANLLPQVEVQNILNEYLATDEEVQNMIQFQNSENFKQYVLDVEEIPEYRELIKFVQNSGIDIYTYMEYIHKILGLPQFIPPTYNKNKFKICGTGLRGMYDDMAEVIPWDEIRNLSVVKYENSAIYRQYYDMLNSPIYKQKYCALYANDDFQNLLAYGLQFGYDVLLINEFNLRIYNIEMTHC